MCCRTRRMANCSIVVWVTPDLVARPILNSQCQASRLILSRENSTPRCVMSDPDLRFTGRIRLAGSHGIGCSKMNTSAHNGSGMVCRRRWGLAKRQRYFGGCNSALLTHPEALSDLSGSPASHFSHWNVRRRLLPEGGTRIRVAPQLGQVGRSVCPTTSICRWIWRPVHSKYEAPERIIPLTCMSRMEGNPCAQADSGSRSA